MRNLLMLPLAATLLMGCTSDIYHSNGAMPHPDRDLGVAFRVFIVDRTDQSEDTVEVYAGVNLPDFITEE